MTNIIKFSPIKKEASLDESYPKPSVKYVPEWYKKIPPYTGGDKKLRFPENYGMPNSSIKRCVPLLDAITSGYMAVLQDDVYVELVNGKPFIRWRSTNTVITWHTPDQYDGFIIPDNYHSMVAKWQNDWSIKVPDGYSVLFSHPSNRLDLPFFTFTGLVNCDKYDATAVQFPFILKREFEGIIEAGTPICQMNLIKNEHWKSEVLPFDSDIVYKKYRTFGRTFVKSYKKNFWTRHRYE